MFNDNYYIVFDVTVTEHSEWFIHTGHVFICTNLTVSVDVAATEMWTSGCNGEISAEHTIRCQYWSDMGLRTTRYSACPQLCTLHRHQTSVK